MNKTEAGFTLIELLLVITILAIISGAIYSSNLSAVRSWDFNRNRIDLQQSARVVISNLTKDARNANTINQGQSSLADVEEMVVDWESKKLEILLSNGQEIEYLLANKELSKDNRVLTAAVVDKITLSKDTDNDRLIEITLKLSHNSQEKTITEQVYLRAITW